MNAATADVRYSLSTDNFGKPTRSKASVVEHLWEADALLSGLVVTDRISNVL
jgi:hypothetical protein